MFSEMFSTKVVDHGRKGVVVLKEKTLVIMYSPGAIILCNHITPVWDGA
jgi:hypothetical protein